MGKEPLSGRLILLLSVLLWLGFMPQAAAATELGPRWDQLSTEERSVLAPFEHEWSSFDEQRKTKWREIAKRYPQMSLYDQWQLQQRMREWARLTPEQRRDARERYKEFEQLPPERKQNVREQREQKQMSDDAKPR